MKKRFLCMLAALILLAAMLTTTAYGAEAAVAFSCDETIGAGQSFSASLEYGGAVFGTASVEVTYDPSVLEFRSCSGGEGFAAEDGLAKITLSGGDGREYLSCKIRFHAVSEGETFITVSASSLYSLDGAELVAETRSVKVRVLSEEEIMEAAGSDAETGDAVSSDSQSGEEGGTDAEPEGGLLGLWAWVKAGIEDGSFAAAAGDGVNEFLEGLSITEFLVLCLCVNVILLLLVLLAAEKGKGKR